MARKKKRKAGWILLSVLAVAIFLFSLWQFGSFDGFFSSVIPMETDTVYDSFYCQDEGFTETSYCNVIGTMHCDESGDSQSQVIFRTNSFSSLDYNNVGTWIAINAVPTSGPNFIVTDNLNGYCRQNAVGGTTQGFIMDTVHNNAIRAWNGDLYIETSGNKRRYSTCTLTPEQLSLAPTQPYTSNGQEITGDGTSSAYSCYGLFEIKDLAGNPLINPESLQCSGSYPCSDNYLYNGIPPGYIVTVTGGSTNEIVYTKFIVPECSNNFCEGDFIRECIGGIKGGLIPCEYGCQDGACIDPYDVEVFVEDERGFERSSFNKNENIFISVNIVTASDISGVINLDIRKGSPQGESALSTSTSFQANTPETFTFVSQTTEIYYITLSIDSDFGTEFYGIEFLELNSFEIVDEFTANLRLTQELGGVQNSNKFYTGYPIKVEYVFKESGDTSALPDSATVTYQIGSGSKLQLINPEISQDDFAGYYNYYLTPEQAGTYKFEGTATRGSFTTNPSVKGPYPVEKDSIVIEYDLTFNPVETGKNYVDILNFETRNRNKELIETINTVRIKINGVDQGTIPVKGSNGKYSVDYKFDVDNADYLFLISSTPFEGDLVAGEMPTELIKSGSEEGTSCGDDSECGLFGKCNVGNCETNVFLIVSLVFGFGTAVVIAILIWRFVKNKKKEPSFGGSL